MRSPAPLPDALGEVFTVRSALDSGLPAGRLRRADLGRPFHGVRARDGSDSMRDASDPATQAQVLRERALQYAPRLRPGQFLSHHSAAALLGAPLPLVRDEDGDPVDAAALPVHVSTLGAGPLVRTAGVSGHRADPRIARTMLLDGIPIATPATVWGQLGELSLRDLVILGDYFCRVWRPGPGRPDAGKPPLATRDELAAQLRYGRRRGMPKLRESVELVREDSWSARESGVRVEIVLSGLPEPVLNHDVWEDGFFLGCVDMAYPELRIAIEYQGMLHAERYAHDVERIAALRAAGWTVIEVTNELYRRPDILIARIRAALRAARRA